MGPFLARSVLWYVVFSGFAMNYMVRINANIAIVSMVVPAACRINTNLSCHEVLNVTSSTRIGSFYWNEYQQSVVLGSFFWLHWTTQLPGGVLARKYGGKLVFGLANLSCGLISVIIPWVSHWSFDGLVVLRVIQGMMAGFAWPAMHHLTAHWIPPNERGKFVSAYMGSSVGTAVTYPLFGLINDVLSWEYIYYMTGVIVTIWYICWTFLTFDTPAKHPRISPEERYYIESALGQSISQSKKKMPVPWKQILTSVPLYLNISVQTGGLWSLFTLLTHAPTYFRFIHGWNNRMTGVLSGIPHLCRFGFALLFGTFADWLLKNKVMSQTNIRKLATGVCSLGQGIFVIGLAFSGQNSTAAILNMILATMTHGAVSAGPLASMVDLSPNYASLLLGLSGMVSGFPLFLPPLIVGIFTNNNQTPEQWTKVFLITAGMLIFSAILYLIFGNSDLQPWNEPTQYELVRKKTKKNSNEKVNSPINGYS